MMRDHRIGCISAMFEPHSTNGVGRLEIVVAAHRLVDAEGAHEAGGSRGHAMARIGIEVVAAEAALEELGSGVAFPKSSIGPEPNMPTAEGPPF